MFGGAFVVDNYALAFKGFFLVVAYVTLLLSVDYIGDGDYYQGEFYVLLLTSVLGMMVMASRPRPHHDLRGARDDLDPDVRARRLAQARHEVERGGDQVLPDRRAVVRGDALRHVARSSASAARRCSATSPTLRRDADTAAAVRRRHLPHARRASRSRSARCRSTSGRPTPTRARPRRSPRSSRSRRRPAASSRCSRSSASGSSRRTTRGSRSSGCSPRRR